MNQSRRPVLPPPGRIPPPTSGRPNTACSRPAYSGGLRQPAAGFGLHYAAEPLGSGGPSAALQLAVRDGHLEPAGTAIRTADPTTALALIAQDAVDLLLSAEIRRVRVCGAENCALRFVDRSAARNRRWCSMARCGNRTKARLHQARTQGARPPLGRTERARTARLNAPPTQSPPAAHPTDFRRNAGPGTLSTSSACTA
ncbi:CGNR zinc finger domain-containing protein [Streptomyces sp. NPDC013172]|uniref:CGNR zinc finger domain-containing protein n=1 Tax=Streptomyces sp. NPDC013172 TaxID=3155009 RepID=UPI0033D75460